MFTQARQGVVGFIWVRWVHFDGPRGRHIHSGSRGFSPARLGVFRFVRVRVGSLVPPMGSCGLFRFTIGFTRARVGVVGLIRVCVGSFRRS